MNIDTLTAAISTMEHLEAQGILSMEGGFKLVAYRMLLERLKKEAEDGEVRS